MLTPDQIADAHRFLYYVVKRPAWSDAHYDAFCKAHRPAPRQEKVLTINDFSPSDIMRALSTLNWHILKGYVQSNATFDLSALEEAKEIRDAFLELKSKAQQPIVA